MRNLSNVSAGNCDGDMENHEDIIDFTELRGQVPGEAFQELIRLLTREMGLNPIYTGRGPDQKRDIILTEPLKGTLTNEKIVWIVECKDFVKSGKSVQEKDLPSIKDKLAQHKADGFILATSTTPSSSAKELIDKLDIKQGGHIYTHVWDSAELKRMLIEPNNHKILKQFLPDSYKRVVALDSIEEILAAFKSQVPEEIHLKLMNLIKPYTGASLKGSVIWPYDPETAEKIDRIVNSLIFENNPSEAVDTSINIDISAFNAMINRLAEKYPDECEEYLFNIVTGIDDTNVRFNAAQLIYDNFEVDPEVRMNIASKLDSSDLYILFESEIIDVIVSEVLTNTPDYHELFDSISELSSNTRIDEVHIDTLNFSPTSDGNIAFTGDMQLSVVLEYDHEEMGGMSFPGEFSGYFDKYGIYLDSATIDTSKFFE